MTLYKRGKYYWVSLSQKESNVLGKNRGFSTELKNKLHAEIYLKELKEKYIIEKNKHQIVNHPAGSLLFSEVLEKYIEYKISLGEALSESTIVVYEKALKHFNNALENKIITEYTKEDYSKFVTGMDLAQNTKAIYTGRINALFNFLLKEDYIKTNYFRTVKEEVKKQRIITENEMEKFLEYAKQTKYYDIIMFMKIGAFRASEALSINETNIKNEHIEIVGKGNKIASIPIINEMREFLNELPNFEHKKNYNSLRQFFNRATKKLEFKINSHDLRKYQLSRFANSGVNIYFVKNYARHSNIKTTLKYYALVDMEKMKEEIDSKFTTLSTTIITKSA